LATPCNVFDIIFWGSIFVFFLAGAIGTIIYIFILYKTIKLKGIKYKLKNKDRISSNIIIEILIAILVLIGLLNTILKLSFFNLISSIKCVIG